MSELNIKNAIKNMKFSEDDIVPLSCTTCGESFLPMAYIRVKGKWYCRRHAYPVPS